MSFVLGANLPWVRYGGDFGSNAWFPAGGLASHDDAEPLLAAFERLESLGVTVVRWFLLCDMRAGVEFDAQGVPIALDGAVERDLEFALALLERRGLRMMPVLFDFHLCRPRRIVNGVQLGGRGRLLRVAELRARLLEAVVEPLLLRYGSEPHISAWDLFNEPEWATFAVGSWNPVTSVSRAAMRTYLQEATSLVHALTSQPVTVGSASIATLDLVRGLGLDFYQAHWYDRLEHRAPITRACDRLGCDAPVVLGEFPTRGSQRTPAELVALARKAGYAGAYFWSVLADDPHSQFDAFETSLATLSRGPIAST
jgi:hypothetical protein